MLHLYDTARAAKVVFEPREAGKVSMYVCGPTVYGPPHIGHGRMTLVFDVIRRYLTWSGFDVTFVSNITDIDDNIINRALREDRPWEEITTRCEAVWFEAMDSLDVLRPTHTPHATEYVDEMVGLIRELLARDLAYQTTDGVYLDVNRVEGYGLLAQQDLDMLRSGARVEANEEKRSPLDFVLWKLAKPGEPVWPSPWGDGRPGWNTECVVMSLDLLDDGFDIHGGGQDLKFPHHENERAQAVALDRQFARYWLHNGFVEVDGEKMSKSLGNVRNLVDLLEIYDPRAYRTVVLQSHYRTPIDVSDENLRAAEQSLVRLESFARRVRGLVGDPDPAVLDAFRDAMDDDFDTPRALAVMFDAVRGANAALDRDDEAVGAALAAAALEVVEALGIRLADETGAVPDDVLARAVARDEARAAKDWARADQIRDELTSAGWVVEDTPDGTVVRPA